VTDRLGLLSEEWRNRVGEAVDWLGERGFSGKVGLVLGSGLGNFVDAVVTTDSVAYGDIPGYSATTVAEHSGRLVVGEAAGIPVIVMQGRLHPYEGLPFSELLLPTAVLACLGIEAAVVTNAAGGLNRYYAPGDLMVIRDQLDLHFHDPLRGLLAVPFAPAPAVNAAGTDLVDHELARQAAAIGRIGGVPDLYDPELARLLVSAAAECGVPMHAAPTPACTGRPTRPRPRSACSDEPVAMRWECRRRRRPSCCVDWEWLRWGCRASPIPPGKRVSPNSPTRT